MSLDSRGDDESGVIGEFVVVGTNRRREAKISATVGSCSEERGDRERL
jgi:hypothetical protein